MQIIDVSLLRQETADAVHHGKRLRQQEINRLAAEVSEKQKASEAFAKFVIAQIPRKCHQAAGFERTHAVVMSLVSDKDYDGFDQPKVLKGAGKIVWDACLKSQLHPTIEFWHDGVGVSSGYNIVVHW